MAPAPPEPIELPRSIKRGAVSAEQVADLMAQYPGREAELAEALQVTPGALKRVGGKKGVPTKEAPGKGSITIEGKTYDLQLAEKQSKKEQPIAKEADIMKSLVPPLGYTPVSETAPTTEEPFGKISTKKKKEKGKISTGEGAALLKKALYAGVFAPEIAKYGLKAAKGIPMKGIGGALLSPLTRAGAVAGAFAPDLYRQITGEEAPFTPTQGAFAGAGAGVAAQGAKPFAKLLQGLFAPKPSFQGFPPTTTGFGRGVAGPYQYGVPSQQLALPEGTAAHLARRTAARAPAPTAPSIGARPMPGAQYRPEMQPARTPGARFFDPVGYLAMMLWERKKQEQEEAYERMFPARYRQPAA